ncbi:MAG: glycosyl transferase [Chloroflexi bacterium]|nr:glycosyl transferase [Chloroflexota bacterium]
MRTPNPKDLRSNIMRVSHCIQFRARVRSGILVREDLSMLDPRRILVVKLADLGDLLTATPALRALRLRFPRAEITALVTPHTACLLDRNDAMDGVITFPKAMFDSVGDLLRPFAALRATGLAARLAWQLAWSRYDVVVLLHHLTTRSGTAKYRALVAASRAPVRVGLDNGTGTFLTHRAADAGFGARHEADYWLDVVGTLGAAHPAPRMELHLSTSEREHADARWYELGLESSNVVAIHPGSGTFSVARRWAPERFAAVGDALAADGLHVVLVAGPGEEQLVQRVRREMRAPCSVLEQIGTARELAAMLRGCRLFIGNDSGVMHCAAAVDAPVVAVFGLSNHRAWGPYPPDRHEVVRLDLPCSPCFYPPTGLGTPQGCGPRACLSELPPHSVIAAARRLLARNAELDEAHSVGHRGAVCGA